jgi:hypothetical protein
LRTNVARPRRRRLSYVDPVTEEFPEKRRANPLRGVLLGAAMLLIIPSTRDLVLSVIGGVVAVVVGALIALLIFLPAFTRHR